MEMQAIHHQEKKDHFFLLHQINQIQEHLDCIPLDLDLLPMDTLSSHGVLIACCLFLCISFTSSTNFSVSSFSPNEPNINVSNAATETDRTGHHSLLVPADSFAVGSNGTGRAYYIHPILLVDPSTNKTTDFSTYFEFYIYYPNNYNQTIRGGGFSFFVTSQEKLLDVPENSGGGWLGLFNETTDGNPANQMVAVEFDTYKDEWDPSNNHVGVNVNSIRSEANKTYSITMVHGGYPHGARISYNGTSNELSVQLNVAEHPVDSYTLNLTHVVNLREWLPDKVFVGFSGSIGDALAVQGIRNWNFTSTFEIAATTDGRGQGFKAWSVGLVIGLTVLVVGLMSLLYVMRRNARKKKQKEEADGSEDMEMDGFGDEEIVGGAGPKWFPYKELVAATNNFSEEGKLGQGGFGGVYKGYLTEQKTEIAVKKVSSNSKQGRKEYVTEVNTIGHLRHRNLVQLIGWSHQRGSFLLAYEYLPNGSLDAHLYGKKHPPLSWPTRYKIARELASGLLYLHEEWEQCVVHRDIKSSNVMLDANYSAKLGDFGLARLVDHSLGSQTTVIAGTMGYMAPECMITSRASKESDVFSFGVVALEIACGRKVVEPMAEGEKVYLVNWVWMLYGSGRLVEAADETLAETFDADEMIRLMSVGLWCAHPDHNHRPSIRQAIQVLNSEATVPILPSQMPVPGYYASTSSLWSQLSLTTDSSLMMTASTDSTTQSSTITASTISETKTSQEEYLALIKN